MSNEIFFDGARFIPVYEAAASSQLTRDYIGKLCREGTLLGKRVGRNWFVDERSLREFLVHREYRSSVRSETLSHERAKEYRGATATMAGSALDIRNRLAQNLAAGSRGSGASQLFNLPAGAAQAALSVVHVPPYAVSPAVELAHKLLALTFAIALTFGAFALLEPQYTEALAASARADMIAITSDAGAGIARVMPSSQQFAAAGRDPAAPVVALAESIARGLNASIDNAVYAIAYPNDASSGDIGIGSGSATGAVTIEVQPYEPAASANAAAHVPSQTGAAPQPSVIEKIVQVPAAPAPPIDTSQFATHAEVAQLASQVGSLVSLIPAPTAPVPQYIAGNGNPDAAYSAAQSIDQLSGTNITNATITGGSISGVALDAGSLSGDVGIGNGGTGTSTAPGYGELLLGDGSGNYALVATSSLGFSTVTSLSALTDVSLNATSSGDLLGFNGSAWTNIATSTLGITSLPYYASSTIGDGTASGGLTISGNATTTGSTNLEGSLAASGNAYFGGNVGIGTTSPNEPLTIQGDTENILAESKTSGESSYMGYNDTNGDRFLVGIDGEGFGNFAPGAGLIATWSDQPLLFATDQAERMRITSAGNVGIGTTSPVSALSVVGSIYASSTATSTFQGAGINLTAGCFSINGTCIGSGASSQWTTSGSAISYASGDVGIGTTSPRTTLQVSAGGSGVLPQVSSIAAFESSGNGYISILTPSADENGILFGSPTSNVDAGIIYNNNANLRGLVFRTGGNQTRMVIDSSGDVGIGTTSPSATLAVAGGSYFAGNVGIGTASPNEALSVLGNNNIPFSWGNTSTLGYLSYSSNNAVVRASNALIFDTDLNNDRMIIDSSGNVGIGTTTPGSLLSLGSTNGINFSTGTSTFSSTGGINIASGCFAVDGTCIGSGASSQWTTLGSAISYASGDVGIGTTSPYSLLTLSGGSTGNAFEIDSSASAASTTVMTVSNAGLVSIGDDVGGSSGIFTVDASSSTTTIANLSVGNLEFDTDAGIVNLSDIPVDSNAASGVQEAQIINIGGNPLITASGISNGSGGVGSLNVGIGTSTSPYSTLQVWGPDAQSTTQAFAVVNNASTTLFSVNDAGSVGIGTTSPAATLAIAGNIYASSTATSTFQGNGINITAGCFAVNGTCITSGGGGGGSSASSTLLTDSNTWTKLQNFSNATSTFLTATTAWIGTLNLTNALTPANGGTGITTTPTYGQLLVGNSSSGYTLTATSSLGLQSQITGSTGQVAYFSGTNAPVGTSSLSIASTGFVGIGTSTPVDELQVAGLANPVKASAVTSGLSEPESVFVSGRYAYVASQSNSSLVIYDVSNPASPVEVGSTTSGLDFPQSVYVSGRYAYVADGGGSFVVFDISNPASPVEVGSTTTGLSEPYSVYVSGRYAYVADLFSGLAVFDISNPTSPVNVGQTTTGLSHSYSVSVSGRYAYVADQDNGLVVFDVSNPTSPTEIGSTASGLSEPESVFVSGRYAYVASYTNSSLVVFDISNPASPVEVGSATSGLLYADSVFVSGRYAYVAGYGNSSLVVFDVSNPASPVKVGSTTSGLEFPQSVFVSGRYAYVANSGNNSLTTFQIGGEYAQSLEAGTLQAGSLELDNNLQALDGAFSGGLTVGNNVNVGGSFDVTASTFDATSTTQQNYSVFSINTASSTNPLFTALYNGNIGIGTTTPGSIFSIDGVANWTNATTTYYSSGGIDLASGCFSVDGTCISGGGGSSASSTLLIDNNTFTGTDTFSDLLTLNGGLTAYASSTIGDGTNGLTVSGNATTTGNQSVGDILQINNPTATRDFELYSKNAGVTFPVPTFYPVAANSVEALDLEPSGSPSESTAGYAWEDICDASSPATTCARIGATSQGSVFGNNSFNGASPKPSIFTANSIEGFRIDTSGNLDIGTTTASSKVTIGGGGGLAIGTDYGITAPASGAIIEGDLGIGTTSPSNNLEVNGTTLLNGQVTQANGTLFLRGESPGIQMLSIGANDSYTNTSGSLVLGSIGGNQTVADTGTLEGYNAGPQFTDSTAGDTLNGLIGFNISDRNFGAGIVTTLEGLQSQPANSGTGTTTTLEAVNAVPANTTAGTTTTMYGIRSLPAETGTGTVTNMFGIYSDCAVSNASGSIGTCYELYLATPTKTGTISNEYGLYQQDSAATNYFAGNVGIASTTPGSLLSIGSTNGINFSTGTSSFSSTGGINLASGCFAVGGTCLSSGSASQLTSTYTVDSNSASISVGDVVSYINGNAREGLAVVNTPVSAASVNSAYEAAADLDSTHFVLVYEDTTNSNHPTAVIGTISGTSISYGTPVSLASVTGIHESVAAINSTSFVVSYIDTTNSSHPTAIISSVSGTTITPGTATSLASVTGGYTGVAVLDSSHFVVAFNNSTSAAEAVVASFSGSTITPGTAASLDSHSDTYESVAALNSTHFVVGYEQGAVNEPAAVVSSVSGTTITAGAPVTVSTDASVYAYLSVAALDSADFVESYTISGPIPEAFVASVSGTTITAGSSFQLSSDNGLYTSVADVDSTHFMVTFEDESNSNHPAMVISSVASRTITAGITFPLASVSSTYETVALAGPFFVAGYADNSTHPTAVLGYANGAGSNILGVATAAASPGGTVQVASNGVVTGLSGLTAGSTYYWDAAKGLSTTASTYKVGIALTSGSLLLDSGSGAGGDQFFGDAVFANNFRITEAPGNPQGLLFENQLGREIASLDEDGNFTLMGSISAPNLDFLLGTTTGSELTATSTSPQSPPAGALAGASQTLMGEIAALDGNIIHAFQDVIYAVTGVFKTVYAQEVHTDTLCVSDDTGETCITRAQLDALLANASSSEAQSASATSTQAGDGGASAQSSGAGDATSTPDSTVSTSSEQASSPQAPVISIDGNDPATVEVGASYQDLGATITGPEGDLNLGIEASVDGGATTSASAIVIDTSVPGTHTILYSATDQNGLTGTASREVDVVAATSTETLTGGDASPGGVASSSPSVNDASSTPPMNDASSSNATSTQQ